MTKTTPGELLLVGVPGPEMDAATAARLKKLQPGGFILSCGKHFPGYTFAGLDPHHELPRIPRSRAELDECELQVFRAFARKVDSMMIGHGHYPCFGDEVVPAAPSMPETISS
jgi:beta-N-acetylhexosaminidase